jgi:hypothetical protein
MQFVLKLTASGIIILGLLQCMVSYLVMKKKRGKIEDAVYGQQVMMP